MSIENVDEALKVIIVGNGQVGKSSMLKRYCKGEWTDKYKKTIGTDFLEREIYLKSVDETVKLFLWDTAGQDDFDQLTAGYYRGAACCVLAFSTDDRDSFGAVRRWKDKVDKVCGEGNVVMALVQTKIDLIETNCKVNGSEAEELGKELGVKFFRTSTKENFNVDEVFMYLAETYLTKGKTQAGEGAMSISAGTKLGVRGDAPAAKQGFTTESTGSTTTSSKASKDEPKEETAQKITLGPSTVHAKKKKKILNTCSVL